MNASKFPCPCCGYLVFEESPGSYDICPICFWEDDISQLRFSKTAGGANRVNLVDGQKNYVRDGVSEFRLLPHVRQPNEFDLRDLEWRLIDETIDNLEESICGIEYGETYPENSTQLYYWRENYWRR